MLPRAKAFGELSVPIQRYGWCYLSTPLGTHLEQEDPPQEVLRAVAEVAEALGRLQDGVGGRGGLLHRWVGSADALSVPYAVHSLHTCWPHASHSHCWKSMP